MPSYRTIAIWFVVASAGAGCGEALPGPGGNPTPAPVEIGSQFDAANAGTINGRVVWDGPHPLVPPLEIRYFTAPPSPPRPRLVRDHPFAPLIHSASGGVGNAVVFLRKVDPRKARPWDHGPVAIDHQERSMEVVQGSNRSRVGFVQRGTAIALVSHEPVLNIVQARGAAFFSLALPEADQPLSRVLTQKGRVDLTSGAGYYWMRATLFVDDHPYYARTDAQGAFVLPQVPPGRYQLVCWMANWNKLSHDREPESGLITRMTFQPTLEMVQDVDVEARAEVRLDFKVSSPLFQK